MKVACSLPAQAGIADVQIKSVPCGPIWSAGRVRHPGREGRSRPGTSRPAGTGLNARLRSVRRPGETSQPNETRSGQR